MQTFDFQAWLKSARSERGFSYRTLGDKAGLSHGHINNLEKGTSNPTDNDLRALAPVFDVESDWLIAQVDTTRDETRQKFERLKKHAPEFLGLPAKKAAARAALRAVTAPEPKPKPTGKPTNEFGREIGRATLAAGTSGYINPPMGEFDELDGERFTE